jgi:hypothetical protein
MPKRFLNISYAGRKTRINITEMEDLSEVQDKIKEKFANSLAQVDAADIQLCDQQGTVIEKWASLNSLQDDYFKEGGACLVVSTFPSFEYPPQKRLRAAVEIPDLTLLFKSFFILCLYLASLDKGLFQKILVVKTKSNTLSKYHRIHLL